MKKTLYFYALIACLCVFWLKTDIIHALDFPFPGNSTNFSFPTPSTFQQTDIVSGRVWTEIDYINNDSGGGTLIFYDQPADLTLPFTDLTDYPTYFSLCASTTIGGAVGCSDFVYNFYETADGVFSASLAPPEATILISTPASGTTITDTATTLDGSWSGIDPAIYHNITLYLNSNFIGEQSVAKIIPVDDWTGNFTIPLSYFGISANGQWNLKGNATYANTQLSDMYITTDLISPVGYNLIFDVDGFHTPYTFTDFDTWYDSNVANYDSPSAWASGMIGYLQPILEKIAEFGARMQDYLDTSTSWQRGNDIGSVFPVINAYILKINIFFGGFPIAQFFQWGILIMIGMFAIKIILKLLSFIPVIGGGG